MIFILFQKATGHLGLNPNDPELKAIVEWVRSKGKTEFAPPQSSQDKKRELFQKATGLLGYHPDVEPGSSVDGENSKQEG